MPRAPRVRRFAARQAEVARQAWDCLWISTQNPCASTFAPDSKTTRLPATAPGSGGPPVYCGEPVNMGGRLPDTESPLAQLTVPVLTETISPRMGAYTVSDVTG